MGGELWRLADDTNKALWKVVQKHSMAFKDWCGSRVV